ncbi:hypothetical protein BDFG_02981 [Blastomyces dermatitidis ATCC 26199]|nr:hypothetical protein BDFG_02981 [Blastomyces dermatitidis ATCC 26199]
MTSPLVLALGIILGAYVILSALLHLTQDAKEPPMIETSIHTICKPAVWAHSGHAKIYGGTKRLIKTVVFAPVEAQAAEAVMGVGPAGNAIIGSDKMLENDSYLSTFVLSTHPALAPDPGLDAISCAIARHLSDSIEKLSLTVELFSWVRGEIFRAITESTYGPKNPFRDPALEKAWFPDEKRKTPFTFRPFGGGTVLCPGRHFVTAGVLSFVILLLLRFDLKPAIKDGRWLELRKKMSMTADMPVPKDEMPVKLAPRNTQKGPVDISTIGGKLFY